MLFSSSAMLQEINEASETSDRSLLIKWADHDHPQIRQEVADNHNTPVESLRLLAVDDDFDVVFAVAENPRTPNDLLTFLSHHADQEIRKVASDTLRGRRNGEISYLAPNSNGQSDHQGIVHGTTTGYRKYQCRCAACVAAYRQKQTLHEINRKARFQANIGNPPNHGTINGYRNYKCRCEACKEAGRVYERTKYHRQKMRRQKQMRRN